MNLRTVSEAPRIDAVPFDARRVVQRPDLEVVTMNLTVTDQVPPHEMPMPVLFYVVEGDGIFLWEGSELPVGSDTLLHCPQGGLRGWRNGGDRPLRLAVFKHLQAVSQSDDSLKRVTLQEAVAAFALDGVDGHLLLERREVRVRHLVVKPGYTWRTGPDETGGSVIYVLSGEARLSEDGEEAKVSSHTLNLPAPRGGGSTWVNTGQENLNLLQINIRLSPTNP